MADELAPLYVLVLCTGNICRSPIAEAALRQMLNGFPLKLSSAGLSAPIGVKPDPFSVACAASRGIAIDSDKRSIPVMARDLAESDLILVMENGHKWDVLRRAPKMAGKTYLLGQWTCREIQDPIGQGREVFEMVTDQILDACNSWTPRIRMLR